MLLISTHKNLFRSWHNLIRSLQPSELAISRNNHNLRLLAVQVSSFRSSQPEENLSEKKKKNKKNKKKDEVISKKSNITCGPLDSALWFDSLEKLIETVPFSSPHRSVPLIGDILLTVLLVSFGHRKKSCRDFGKLFCLQKSNQNKI